MCQPLRAVTSRRIALLAVAAAIAGALGVLWAARAQETLPPPPASRPATSPQQAEEEAETERPARLGLREAVGRLVILRFNGPSLPGYVERALREGRAAGVVLFDDNVVSPGQLRGLARDVRRAANGRGLVLADQEGGEVRIVPWAGPERSASAQAAAGTVRADSRTAGEELRASGVDVALAPVADVIEPGSALSGRGFGGDEAAVAEAVGDAVTGFREGGILPTVKHFPGLGTAGANTDDAPVTIDGRPPLEAFEAGIEAGAPLVMLSHATYPALDPEAIASQSEPVIEGLLRDELGFEGVAITDSLEAEAVIDRSAVDVAAERSVRAGIDLILTTGRGSSLQIYRRLLATARRSDAFAARVREAAKRVDALPRR